jgi:hypothetical protein
VDKTLWTDEGRQPGNLAATPPWACAAGAAAAVLDTYLHTLLQKNFLNYFRNMALRPFI